MSRTRYTRRDVPPPTVATPFLDTFSRPDGALGNGWVDLSTANSTDYNPLGIVGGRPVCTDHTSRPGTPEVEPVGGAYRTMPTAYATSVRVSVQVVVNEPHEPAPLLHVVPGTAETGVGCWYSTEIGDVLLCGSICDPPEDFATYFLGSKGVTLQTGDWLAVQSNGTEFSVYVNGVIQTMNVLPSGTSTTMPVPANLQGSRNHGFAYDGHFDPASNTPFLSQVLIEPGY